jgi:hypothetical protein
MTASPQRTGAAYRKTAKPAGAVFSGIGMVLFYIIAIILNARTVDGMNASTLNGLCSSTLGQFGQGVSSAFGDSQPASYCNTASTIVTARDWMIGLGTLFAIAFVAALWRAFKAAPKAPGSWSYQAAGQPQRAPKAPGNWSYQAPAQPASFPPAPGAPAPSPAASAPAAVPAAWTSADSTSAAPPEQPAEPPQHATEP